MFVNCVLVLFVTVLCVFVFVLTMSFENFLRHLMYVGVFY